MGFTQQQQEKRTPWFDVEWLPAYAPDLNPVEGLWSCTKHGDLANYAPDDLFDLGDAVVTPSTDNAATDESKTPTSKPPNLIYAPAHLWRRDQ